MTRSMTPAEKTRFHGYFPGLNVDAAVVTGEATSVYNCIRQRALERVFDAGAGEQEAMKEKIAKSYLSASQKKALLEEVREIPEQVKTAFEKAFRGWKETWLQRTAFHQF